MYACLLLSVLQALFSFSLKKHGVNTKFILKQPEEALFIFFLFFTNMMVKCSFCEYFQYNK